MNRVKPIIKVETKTTVQYEVTEEDFRILFMNNKLKGLPIIKQVSDGVLTFTWETNHVTMDEG